MSRFITQEERAREKADRNFCARNDGKSASEVFLPLLHDVLRADEIVRTFGRVISFDPDRESRAREWVRAGTH